jgi:hypothetical protein
VGDELDCGHWLGRLPGLILGGFLNTNDSRGRPSNGVSAKTCRQTTPMTGQLTRP